MNEAHELFLQINHLSANPTKWPNTQTIRRQIANELLECVWPLYEIGA